jgi:hypothetical protein
MPQSVYQHLASLKATTARTDAIEKAAKAEMRKWKKSRKRAKQALVNKAYAGEARTAELLSKRDAYGSSYSRADHLRDLQQVTGWQSYRRP